LDGIKNVRAVLFDVDDTLFDRSEAENLVLEIIVKRLAEVFQSLKMERITTAFGESDQITTSDFYSGAPSEGLRDKRSRLFLRALGINEDHADTITDMYVREYPAVNAPMPGARTIVGELSRKYMTGVVSNGFPDVQYAKLETIGLKQDFSCIVLSEEIGIRKPDPGIFLHAASLLKVKPGECLYVGDSYANDVTGATNAGMAVCWFNRERVEAANGDIQPDFTICDLEELTILLEKN
jgi:putative hydrolase of the HAD superfamily